MRDSVWPEIDDNTLSLSPVITKAMVAKALANPFEFTDAGWSVSVAYPLRHRDRLPEGK
jgi:hypothetical protein